MARAEPAIYNGGQLQRGGRQPGARQHLTDKFFRDLAATWQEMGPMVIRRVAQDDPSTFVRVVAALMPRNVHVEGDLPLVHIRMVGADTSESSQNALHATIDDEVTIAMPRGMYEAQGDDDAS